MTKKKVTPAPEAKEASKEVSAAEATQILNAERQQRVAVVQAGIQTLLEEQRCTLDSVMTIMGNSGEVSSQILISPIKEE